MMTDAAPPTGAEGEIRSEAERIRALERLESAVWSFLDMRPTVGPHDREALRHLEAAAELAKQARD